MSTRRDDGTSHTPLTHEQRRRAFREQLLPLLPSLSGAALVYTQVAWEAEELTEQALISAYGAFDQLPADTDVRVWLHYLLRAAYLSRETGDEDTTDDDAGVAVADTGWPATSGDGDESANCSEALPRRSDAEVTDAIAGLPEPIRAAVYLADIEGFSYEELGVILQLPVDTAAGLLHRGRCLVLCALLEQDETPATDGSHRHSSHAA